LVFKFQKQTILLYPLLLAWRFLVLESAAMQRSDLFLFVINILTKGGKT
jgi:hypothetical protein